MHKQREQLIAALAGDLTPVVGAGRTRGAVAAALGASLVCGIGAVLLRGPLRPGSLGQLGDHPQFLAECALGLAAAAALAAGGIRLAVPDLRRPLARAALPLACLGAWLALLLYGLHEPALAPSMAGKRAGCWIETAAVALPGLLVGLLIARRLWPLHGAWSGLLLGCAAGVVPAVTMQLACMYVPLHGILHHVLPGLAVGVLGAAAGAVALGRR